MLGCCWAVLLQLHAWLYVHDAGISLRLSNDNAFFKEFKLPVHAADYSTGLKQTCIPNAHNYDSVSLKHLPSNSLQGIVVPQQAGAVLPSAKTSLVSLTDNEKQSDKMWHRTIM